MWETLLAYFYDVISTRSAEPLFSYVSPRNLESYCVLSVPTLSKIINIVTFQPSSSRIHWHVKTSDSKQKIWRSYHEIVCIELQNSRDIIIENRSITLKNIFYQRKNYVMSFFSMFLKSTTCNLSDVFWSTWVAQSVKRPTSVQVMVSWFVGLSPSSDFVLAVQSLEPASDSVSPSLSDPPLPVLCLPADKTTGQIHQTW